MSPRVPSASRATGQLVVRRFPAEWEPCAAVWIAWPHNPHTWPKRFDNVPAAFARFIATVAESVPVHVLAAHSLRDPAQRQVGHLRGVRIVEIETNDCWVRDSGPTFVFQSRVNAQSLRDESGEPAELVAVDWNFNAWGGKYEPHDLDAAVAGRIAHASGLRRLSADLTLEGGALEGDGQGRLLINPACVIDPNRNPHLFQHHPARGASELQTQESLQAAVAQSLHRTLGVHEVVWIDGGSLPGDDTDGHIDQIARFLDPETVVAATASSPDVAHAAGLEANLRQLRLWASETSPAVAVHRLPTPPPRLIEGAPVPQSYCNFLRLGRDRLLMPTFADRQADDRALGILRDLCPNVQIDTVPCEDIAWGLGALHCASCHQPA